MVKHEKSAGAVIFHHSGGKIRYLLLHYPPRIEKNGAGHWDYVKGHVERGENEKETLLREAKEETHLDKKDLEFIADFLEKIEYWFKTEDTLVHKIVDFYLLESRTKKVKLSFEHDDYKWLSYKKAKETLTFDNAKRVLEKAHKRVTSNE